MSGKQAYTNALSEISKAVSEDGSGNSNTAVARFFLFGDGSTGPLFGKPGEYDTVTGLEEKACSPPHSHLQTFALVEQGTK